MTNTVSRTISDEVLDAAIQIESSGNPNIKASTSSALGLGQFLNATWLGVVRKHAPELFSGRTEKQVLALRTNPAISIEMLARFWEDNQRLIGMAATPGDLYLAHFLGAGTAKQVFRADPKTACEDVVDRNAIKANRSIFDKYQTCGALRGWADKKMKANMGKGWVRKYYKPRMANEQDLVTDFSAQKKIERPDLPEDFHGDLDLYDTQIQLREMNYDAGLMDGVWGGRTSGVISAFINDRGGFMPAPTSIDQFRVNRPTLQKEIDRAEAEKFKRPVTLDRADADKKTVEKVAPEVVPTKRSYLASLWGSIAAFFTAFFTTIQNYIAQAWDFFTNNKDSLPTDPNFVTGFLHKVPVSVWIFLGAIILGFIAFQTRKAAKKITKDVQEGVR